MSKFVHLHLHSRYSEIDGTIKIPELIQNIKKKGMDSVAITDHGNLYNVIHFYNEAKKNGIKPIIGCEVYLANNRFSKQRQSFHLVLLAKNNEGYKNLIYLVSMGFLEGFYYKPRIDRDLLKEHHKGLIGLSACLGGVISKAFKNQGIKEATAKAKELNDIFEPGDFYLELQDSGYVEQWKYNNVLRDIGRELNIPLVVTCDAHYLNKEDADAHDIIMAIGRKQLFNDWMLQKNSKSDELYVKTFEQIYNVFAEYAPEAIENTEKISNQCNVELDLGKIKLPNFDVPEGRDQASYFSELARNGLQERFKEFRYTVNRDDYKKRLEYEIDVITRMEFSGYYLIVWDIVKFCLDNKIPVGPGRGSGAGSLVAYSLKITDIDPIKYGLIFERFLNPERVSMPDFDIDFCTDKRVKVIDYISHKYGKNNVGQIITHSTLSAKSALKDVAKSFDIEFGEINGLTRNLPNLVDGKPLTMKHALEIEPKLTEIQSKKPIYKKVINISEKIQGLNRQTGVHAAGVVIGDRPLWEVIPIKIGKNREIVTQFEKDEVEQTGLIKFDILGLKTLTLISGAEKRIGNDFSVKKLSPTDPKVFELISSGDTDGVFQLESSGLKDLIKELKPDNFEDLSAVVALYRPGPLESGYVEQYVKRKKGLQEIKYDHPKLEPILNNTYGVIVYQEQVMQISRDLCGFTMGRADVLRKAMGKKKNDLMAELKSEFVNGSIKYSNWNKADASRLFESIEKFAGYAFNKAHSASYALISYYTAYLKKYYPKEFFASLLSTEMDNQDKIIKYIKNCKKNGIKILPPSVIKSNNDFTIIPEGIMLGLGAIKEIGDSAVGSIIESRPFRSVNEFCLKVDLSKVNSRAIKSLIKSGAMDGFGKTRNKLFHMINKSINSAKKEREITESGQSIFLDEIQITDPEGNLPELNIKEKLKLEKDALGFYVSGHPLEYFDTSKATKTTKDLENNNEIKSFFKISCMVTEVKDWPYQKNKLMAFLTLEDLYGQFEAVAFDDVYLKYREELNKENLLMLTCFLQKDRKGKNKIQIKSVDLLQEKRI